MIKIIPEPWKSFFAAIDGILEIETRVDIPNGFVVAILYIAPRTPSYANVVGVIPNIQTRKLIENSAEDSVLYKQYAVYDRVRIAASP